MTSNSPTPDDYPRVLAGLKERVRTARYAAVRTVNTQLIALYWDIGTTILERQEQHGWGAKVIERLSGDLRSAFPDMTGFSRSNLEYMRRFARVYRGESFPQQAAGEFPWGHIMVLLDKVTDPTTRDWYAAAAAADGWSRNVLLNQIMNQTHRRIGAAPTNFPGTLPVGESDLARELVKDPYVFDFLAQARPAHERDLEQALMDRLQQTLMELGRGFAFVGRQVHFEVDGDDFYVDLLFFHVQQLRYLVIELKVGKFTPQDAGQLGFYVALVDDRLRLPETHASTVGILLCASKNDGVVEYALRGTSQPVAVARYTYDALPTEMQTLLPTPEEVLDAMDDTP